MTKKQDIPVTRDFDDKNIIGSLNINIDTQTMELVANGLLTFAPAYIAKFPEEIDGVIEYKDAELIELSLIPTQNYINYLKQNGKYNDNDNNTNSIEK